MTSALAPCPHCGAALVPIVYGFPAPDAFEQVARGEIVLGGCMMYPGAPDDGCPTKGCSGPAVEVQKTKR